MSASAAAQMLRTDVGARGVANAQSSLGGQDIFARKYDNKQQQILSDKSRKQSNYKIIKLRLLPESQLAISTNKKF